MKFCSKCGKHYQDNDKFCKDCGIELTQGAAEESSLSKWKESASRALAQAESKTKDALSEEHRQKLQEQASAVTKSLKELDAEKGKALASDGIRRFHGLPGNIKKVVAVVLVLVIAFAGYEYFSPEKQVERAFHHTIDTVTELSGKSLGDYTDRDIENFVSLYQDEKKDYIRQAMKKARDYTAKHPDTNSEFTRAIGTHLLSDMKIKSITIHGNKATIQIANKSGVVIGEQGMKKVDGKWYMENLPGDQKN
ncbi:MAG: zinc ribbon domain-containing protein [Selenomonas bovis]|nr:zinc ribbon domain-containing protein [Selenomonas bovis]